MAIERRDDQLGGLTVTTLTIDHPPLNVLDLAHCQELTSALHEVYADDRTRVLVLEGKGKGFSAGVDIRQHTPQLMPKLLPAFHGIFHALLNLPCINIASIHGVCMGGAAELALACDRVIAEENARFSLPEILVGCYPPVAIPLLTHRAGHGRAVGAICGGGEIPLKSLLDWGLIDRVARVGARPSALEEELRMYHGKSPSILGMTARLLHREAQRNWGDRITVLEKEYLEGLLTHPDVEEGIAAFSEKRPAHWRRLEDRLDLKASEGMAQ